MKELDFLGQDLLVTAGEPPHGLISEEDWRERGRNWLSASYDPPLEPWVELPEQSPEPDFPQGEKRLLLAMLFDAVFLIKWGLGHIARMGRIPSRDELYNWNEYRKALEWVESPREDPFSFTYVCEHLGLDASAARGVITDAHKSLAASMASFPATCASVA